MRPAGQFPQGHPPLRQEAAHLIAKIRHARRPITGLSSCIPLRVSRCLSTGNIFHPTRRARLAEGDPRWQAGKDSGDMVRAAEEQAAARGQALGQDISVIPMVRRPGGGDRPPGAARHGSGVPALGRRAAGAGLVEGCLPGGLRRSGCPDGGDSCGPAGGAGGPACCRGRSVTLAREETRPVHPGGFSAHTRWQSAITGGKDQITAAAGNHPLPPGEDRRDRGAVR